MKMGLCLDVNKPIYRFTVLLFSCLLTFGPFFCFNMPTVLQDYFQGNSTCNKTDKACCHDCLGMTGSQFNLLFAVFAWMNAIVVIGAGFLIDKYGNRMGVILFSSLCVIGSSVFALGTMFKEYSFFIPLMLLGRLLFGAGSGSLTIVQHRITSYWFIGKELALAFGVILAFSRLGSVLNFFLTDMIYGAVGLVWTLWIGTFLCILGFVSAVIVGYLDVRGMRELGLADRMVLESKRVHVSDIRYFSASFWLLCFTIMFFYNVVLPFIADASKFIQDKYHYSPDVSAYIASAVYDVAMVLSPFLGGVIDILGKRGFLSVSCAILTIPVFGLLAFTHLHPLCSTLWLGVTYSIAAASMWPSIPLVVSQATLGTALGIATSLQMIGIGVSSAIVGAILGKNESLQVDEVLVRWKYVMIYFLGNTLACVPTALALNVDDKRKGGILNMSRKEVQKQSEESAEETKSLLDHAAVN